MRIRTFSHNRDLIAERRDFVAGNAARLFCDKGYDKVSIREIAKACGINHATIYHYFGSKTDIVRFLAHMIVNLVNAYYKDHIIQNESPSPTVDLKMAIRICCILLDKYSDIATFMVRDISQFAPDVQKTLFGYRRGFLNMHKTILDKGCKTREFSVADTELMARNIAMICENWAIYKLPLTKMYTLNQYIEKQTEFILGCITARSALKTASSQIKSTEGKYK